MAQSEFASERLKIIDQSVRDTVFGWIKKTQKSLPQSSTYFNIPFGVNMLCLLYYSPIFTKFGTYEVEGSDYSDSNRSYTAKYDMEFFADGNVFGQRGKQRICGKFDVLNSSIDFMLSWHGHCYQYEGYFDTISMKMSGKWHILDKEKQAHKGHCGRFEYLLKFKADSSENEENNFKLMTEYQTLLSQHESMKKSLKHIIVDQDAEIFALRLLVLTQSREIDEYKRQIEISSDEDEKKEEDEQKEVDFNEWEWHNIIEWIVSLKNGKYAKYEDVLAEKLMEEEVKGEHLCHIDKNDLHRFGIYAFSDKVDIYQCIQDLISAD